MAIFIPGPAASDQKAALFWVPRRQGSVALEDHQVIGWYVGGILVHVCVCIMVVIQESCCQLRHRLPPEQ